MFAARCKARGVPPYLQFLHLVANTDWPRHMMLIPGAPPSFIISAIRDGPFHTDRLGFWVNFGLITWYLQSSQYYSSFCTTSTHSVPARNSRPLLRHFRDVISPSHGNNAVANNCCTAGHIGDTILQSILRIQQVTENQFLPYNILKWNRKRPSPVSTLRDSTGYARRLENYSTTRTIPRSSSNKGITSTSLKKKNPHIPRNT